MIDIQYDKDKFVSNDSNEERAILKAAVTTLHEAIRKAVSLELDIDYNEINGGWRPNFNNGNSIELFFYDNLSSGAGYSSLIGDVLENVLKEPEKFFQIVIVQDLVKNVWITLTIKKIISISTEN